MLTPKSHLLLHPDPYSHTIPSLKILKQMVAQLQAGWAADDSNLAARLHQ